MQLWRRWLQCVRELRPACGRRRTFLWMQRKRLGAPWQREATRPRAGVAAPSLRDRLRGMGG
jgi:hypothetical protein